MLGFRSTVATLSVATLSLFGSQAALNASAASPAAAFGAATDLAVPAGTESDLTFTTVPDARCSLQAAGNSGVFVVYADDSGIVRLHANPDTNAAATSNLLASCNNGKREAITLLRLHPIVGAVRAPELRPTGPLKALLPPNVDPAAISDAEVERLGLPPRPNGGAAYAAWLRAMTTPVARVAATTIRRSDVIHGPAHVLQTSKKPLAGAVTLNSTWSGIINFGSTGQFNYIVEGEWNVPDVSTSPGASPAYSSLWEGIDGWGSGDVVQNGTSQDAFYDPSFGSLSSYYAWYEFFPDNGSTQFANLRISPGDVIFSESWLCYSSSGARLGCYFIEDLTKGEVAPITSEYGSQPALFRGNSAEWVLERPTVGGTLHPLPYYGTAYMTDEFAWDSLAGGWRAYTSENYGIAYMYNGSNLLSWARPSNLDSSNFYWAHYF